MLIAAAVIALGIAGLPLTGGSLAKLAVKPPLGDGIAYLVATVSSIASALLMLHFLRRLAAGAAQDPQAAAPAGQSWPWLATAVASIAIPWALYLGLPIGNLSDALGAKALWSGLWPVLAGGVLAMGLASIGDRLPSVPEGDVVVVLDCASRASVGWGAAVERTDAFLRRFPVAGLSLLVLALLFGAAMIAGH
jgi:hypothetical protein